MKRRILIISVVCIVFFTMGVRGQDPQFSQFYANPMYLSPSFAGLVEDTRVSANYREQWPNLPEPFLTYSFAIDHNFYTFNSGAAFFFMKDEAGTGNLSTTNFGIQYAYEIKLSDFWYIRPGLHFSYTQRSVNFQKLLWTDQISAAGNFPTSSELPPLENVSDIDFSTSALAYSDKLWIGFGVDHLLKPNQSLIEYTGYEGKIGYVPIKYTFYGGTKIINQGKLYKPYDASLQLAFLYKIQDQVHQLDFGLYWYNKPVVMGLWYRGLPKMNGIISRDAFTALVGFKLDVINIGYSYDFTISRLIGSTGGAHELAISYYFSTTIKKRKLKTVPCPDF